MTSHLPMTIGFTENEANAHRGSRKHMLKLKAYLRSTGATEIDLKPGFNDFNIPITDEWCLWDHTRGWIKVEYADE